MLVIPAVPESVATDGLTHTLGKLHALAHTRHPRAADDGAAEASGPMGSSFATALVAARGARCSSAEVPRLAAFEKAAAEGVPVFTQ